MTKTALAHSALLAFLPMVALAKGKENLALIEQRLAAIQPDKDAPKLKPAVPEPQTKADPVLQIIFEDGFESTTLNPAWSIFLGSGATEAAWAPTTYTANSGSRSAFCAGQGSAAVTPGVQSYPANMSASMVYGPFSLTDASSSRMEFALVGRTEPGFDDVQILITANEFETYQTYTFSGFNFDTWANYFADFADLPTIGDINGQPEVYIAFLFTSDEALGYDGVFVDDVAIKKYVGGTTPTPTPEPTPTPSPTPPPPTPTPTPTPPPGAISKSFSIFNDGTGALQIQGMTKEQNSAWLSTSPATPFDIPAGQSRDVTVQVNPNGLADGVYLDRLLIISNDTLSSPYPDGITILFSAGATNTTGRLLGMTNAIGLDVNSDAVFDAADVKP